MFQSGGPVPSYYKLTLESLDGREDLVTNITVERNGEMVAMHVEESVPPNSLWRASILTYGWESHRIVTNYELSKLERISVYSGISLNNNIIILENYKRYPRHSECCCYLPTSWSD